MKTYQKMKYLGDAGQFRDMDGNIVYLGWYRCKYCGEKRKLWKDMAEKSTHCGCMPDLHPFTKRGK
ncbi:MAG: hypothetical protein GY853_13530 [PVC group bacterium]|nr:hypothetical protein [PVC group bacterium]